MKKCPGESETCKTGLSRCGSQLSPVVTRQRDVGCNLFVSGKRGTADRCIPEIATVSRVYDERTTHARSDGLKTIKEIRVMPILAPAESSPASAGKLCGPEMRPAPSGFQRTLVCESFEQHAGSVRPRLTRSD